MAEKLQPKEEGLQDLETLFPDAEIAIAGRDITVREYSFVQGLRLRASIQPLLAGLAKLTAKPENTPIDAILDLMAEHHDQVLDLIAASAGVERAWIEQLGDADGQALAFTWWRVCGPFFVRQLQSKWFSELLRPLPGASAGGTSSPP
ncbi:hypothetical protein PVT67_15635 [Gallaecimonas kandeliae]|uniref:DUF6631 family protein n=1 Tax=Gallaecimonas kandeliae TaxID=3029055 RepID=UPI0026471ADD|nr:DUF6631 family protein [Gallaecimonas kandeliae]WKE65074.1 hypothetical protein PVT67_15635 [Gallaecimonas kandeliae]